MKCSGKLAYSLQHNTYNPVKCRNMVDFYIQAEMGCYLIECKRW